MPKYRRHKTKYPGIYYIKGTSPLTGKQEKIYYIAHWSNGKKVEEKLDESRYVHTPETPDP